MIRPKTLRRLTAYAKRVAVLHNEAASLARKLKNLSGDLVDFEMGLNRKKRGKEWFEK